MMQQVYEELLLFHLEATSKSNMVLGLISVLLLHLLQHV